MAVDTPEYIESALKVYNVEVHRAIKAQEERLSQLKDAHDQLHDTINTLAELPARLRHQVMVPLGRHAFLPGQLIRTNEILVHLGDQYYVETSAVAAKGILQRKRAVLAEGVSKAQQQLQALKARLEVTHSSLKDERSGEDAIEIRSSLEESDALLATASKHRASEAAVAAGLTEQQQQGTVKRIKAESGYSYTPLTTSSHQHQHPNPEDAELQARLEELIMLEEQQEAAEQAVQCEQQQRLAPINEDEEGTEASVEQDCAAGPAAAAASSKAPKNATVQHLQQLEQEQAPDSDDEDEQQQQQQQQQQEIYLSTAAATGNVEQWLPKQHNQQQQQQQQLAQVVAAAGSSRATSAATGKAASRGLKLALKKGFLTSPSKASASDSDRSTHCSQNSSSSNSTNTIATTEGSASAGSQAFTGAVVERAASLVVEKDVMSPGAAAPAMGHIGTAPVTPVAPPATAPAIGSSTTGSRPSKFKLRRMGIASED